MSKKSKLILNKRAVFILFAFCAVFLLLTIRIGYVQFVDGKELQQKAIEQQTKDKVISSKRGTIYDRNLKVLAQSASVDTVCATPREIADSEKIDEIAANLAEILEMDKQEVLKIITKKSSYEIIKRKIDPEQSAKIRELNYKGIYLTEDSKRYYPYGNFASHVIGFVGTDNQGLNGIEMVYDKYLKGVPGRIITAKNALGTDMPYKYEKYINAQNGVNVVLTIDEVIQHFVEKELEAAIQKYSVSQGAACIIMNAKTGEILAMATKPDFDLNNPFTITNEADLATLDTLKGEERQKYLSDARNRMWRNKAVCDTYEPGSTFKTFVAAMAIEENVVKNTDTFNCPGYHIVGKWRISCHKKEGHGLENFVQGVQNSCNPVFMQVGARVGTEKFKEYYKRFGFMDSTGFELPGEASGLFFSDDNFNEVELATSSFGQGFNITPLQLITAMSAITNNGKMVKPRIVKELIDDEGNVVQSFEPEIIRDVISEDTAKAVREILEGVVSEGTAKNAYIRGMRVAGKTGTSEKSPRGSKKRIASFLGFAPANDPEIIGLVVLDEPPMEGGLYMGGQIAAPTFQKIFDSTLRYLNIDPQYTEEELVQAETTVPNVEGLSIKDAEIRFDGIGLYYKIIGNGPTVISQTPKGGIIIPTESTVMLYTEENSQNTVVVPNVVGKSISEANILLTNAKLNIKITGSASDGGESYVGSQSPEAGESVSTGTIVTVEALYKNVH